MEELQHPTIVDRELLKRLQKFNLQLSRTPPKVATERLEGKDILHVPISVIENTLRRIYFGMYSIELLDIKLMVNEVVCTARIRVYHPVFGCWLNYDGVGAVAVQQVSGSKVADFMQTKLTGAIHKNAGAAYSFAIKNAAKRIGKVFGADLNRKYEDAYQPYNLDAQPLND